MGILSNTASICQFQINGNVPKDNFFEWVGECLAENGFRSIEQGSEELAVGWVQLDDIRESGFALPLTYARDHYLAFSLRRDQRRIPSALFKAHLEVAQNEFLAANPGLNRVPKQKKEDLRDAVRGTLMSKTLPSPAIYDVVWDTRSNLVYFTSLSTKVIEMFEDLFKQTFDGLRLVTVHPFERARRVLPKPLQAVLAQANQATSENVVDLIKDNQWLGNDFLQWAMYQTMKTSSEYRVSQPGPALNEEGFVAYLNDRLVLMGGEGDGVQKITVAGPQDHFREVTTALRGGKQITEANLYLEKVENVWKMNLKGEMFHFASFKAPKVTLEKDDLTDPEREKAAVFYERMSLLEEGLQLFDSLYANFLGERLGEGWAARKKEIEGWLAEG